MAYVAPAQGTLRGSARFNAGLGARNGNPFNINEGGAGLYAAGYDSASPTFNADVRSLYNSKIGGSDPDFAKRVPGELAKHGRSAGNDAQLATTVDWYYSDLARRMDKDNKFGNTVLGKVLGTALQIGASFIPGVGPLASAAIGATIGGIQGGFKGALFGGISGYGIGAGTQWLAGGGLTALGAAGAGKSALGAVGSFGSAIKDIVTSPTALTLGAGAALAAAGGAFGQGGSNPKAATALGTTATTSGATGAAAGTALSTPSPVVAQQPGSFETAREDARLAAVAAVSESDTIKTTPLGVIGKPRTRGKTLLGY